jgi:hypothetical protein
MSQQFKFDRAVAEQELGKAFQLFADGFKVGMFSRAIDAVWHDMAKDSTAYERFSLDACGVVVAHDPAYGIGNVRWVAAYEEAHGKFPPIWFTDENGVLDAAAYSDYLQHGVIRTCWMCTPTHSCHSQPPPSEIAPKAAAR